MVHQEWRFPAQALAKASVSLLLLGSSIAAWWIPRWAQAGASILLALAAYNIGQLLQGSPDCGCFPVRVPPLVTAAIDGVLGSGLWLTGPPEWKEIMSRPRAVALLAVAMLTMCALGNAGWARPIMPPLGALPPPGGRLSVGDVVHLPADHPQTVIVYRTGCERCAKLMTLIRMRAWQVDAHIGPILECDAGAGTLRYGKVGAIGDLAPFAELLARCRDLQTPEVLVITDNRVSLLEDWSNHE